MYLLLQGVFQYSLTNELEVAVYAAPPSDARRKSYAQFCKEHSISGAILSGVTTDDPYLTELLDYKIPCVAVDVPLAGEGFGWISIDNVLAAKQMTAKLLELGHTDIVVVSGKKNAAVNRERMTGCREALRDAGQALEESHILYANFSERQAYEEVRAYLARTPREKQCTAFCCFSDIMALGVMAALRDAGFSIPGDFSVTGFDGLAVAEYTQPALTTVQQDMRAMGYEAMRLLQRVVQNGAGEHITVPHNLLLRDSVAKRG